MTKELYDLGEAPPLGEVPAKMHAWLIRPERFGEPKDAFQKEVVDIPEMADDDVLECVLWLAEPLRADQPSVHFSGNLA